MMFNGCSFVEQSHLELESPDWRNLYWPTLISTKHDNLAISGGSNTRIFRTTIDHIYTQRPDTIIIGWTGLDREELPCSNGDRMRLMPELTGFENDKDSHSHSFHVEWYARNHNTWLSFENLLRYILIIQGICKSKNISCWMFNAFHHNYIPYPGQILAHNFNVRRNKKIHKSIDDLEKSKNLIAGIDFNSWIWPPKTTLSQWAQNQGLEFEAYGHPALSAQQTIADYIKGRIA